MYIRQDRPAACSSIATSAAGAGRNTWRGGSTGNLGRANPKALREMLENALR
jgi:hypothetical protein